MSKIMYSFIVEDEECPKCGHPTKEQDAIHFQANHKKLWTTASANPPYGNVTEDEMDMEYPDEEIPDLILDTKDVTVTCTRCNEPLKFTANEEH